MDNEIKSGGFILDNSPIALVICQLTLVPSTRVKDDKESLKSHGLTKVLRRIQQSFKISPEKPGPPIVENHTMEIILDKESKKGVAIDRDTILYFTNMYTVFEDFLTGLNSVIVCLIEPESNCIVSIALRYLNVFEFESQPTEVVRDTLAGIDSTEVGATHFHHNYHFWCDTSLGRLTLKCVTEHGDRKPRDLGLAEHAYPARCVFSYDQVVGHLDIFETTKPRQSGVMWTEAKKNLADMHSNIDRAFLSAIREDALESKFGLRAK